MRPQPLELRCLFPILLVGVLVFSAHLLRGQETPPPGQFPVPLFDPSVQLAPGPEADAPLRRLPGTLPLSFELNQVQSGTQIRFFPRHAGYDRIPLDDQRGLQLPRPAGTAEGMAKDFAGSASSRGFAFSPAFGKRSDRTMQRPDDLEHYSHDIPWAGPIILRVCQQVKTHPQLTRVLKLLVPAAK